MSRLRAQHRPVLFSLIRLLPVPFLSAAGLVGYADRFGYSALVPPVGAGLIVVAMTWPFFAFVLLEHLFGQRTAKRTAMSVLAIAFIALMLIYLAAMASNALWGDALNYGTLLSIVLHGTTVLTEASTLYSHHKTLVFGCAIALLLGCSAAFWLARLGSDAIAELSQGLNRRWKRPLASIVTGAVACGSSIAFAVTCNSHIDRLHGEPVLSFLKIVRVSNMMKADSVKVAESLKDKAFWAQNARLTPERALNVIIIFADLLRADHTSVYGYQRDTTPFLHKLYVQGRLHKVEMALSTCSEFALRHRVDVLGSNLRSRDSE